MSLQRNNLYLVGLMGSGKTTIGRMLARRLGRRFLDSDHEIEHRTGVKIPVIFELEGEEGFRRREAQTIAEISQENGVVLATGGGAVLDPANRKLLSETGWVVYLDVPTHVLFERTRRDTNRPLLRVANPQGKLNALRAERDPLYREIADLVIDGSRSNSNASVMRILKEWETSGMGNTMRTLNVALGERAYPIHIGSGLLTRADTILSHLKVKRVAIVSNTIVAPLYLASLSMELREAGVIVTEIVLPDGEEHKNWETLNLIFDGLLSNRCERSTTIIALGGGVIGDMAGFAAASYQRGVPFIQIPTTLLSQVDSSVGGKTAINHPLGKNMVGAFYQPRLVLIDIDTLKTLPDRELKAGMAEVIKYGLLRDLSFLEWIETNLDKLLARDAEALSVAIERSCRAKAEIVAADETEQGERALLNLGHTFGHAIETGMGYGVWLHGEAVAAGTVMAAELSARLGMISSGDADRVRRIFERTGLPIKGPALGVERYIELMHHDKKVADGKLRLILLQQVGKALICDDVPIVEVEAAIASCME